MFKAINLIPNLLPSPNHVKRGKGKRQKTLHLSKEIPNPNLIRYTDVSFRYNFIQ